MSKLSRLLGPIMFNRLCDVAGGTRLYIPEHFGTPPGGGRDTRRRFKRLGFDDSLALLLIFHFGGRTIPVPQRAGHNGFDRVKLKRLAKRTDLSANEIARRVGCDCRTVERNRRRSNGHTQELRP